MPITYRTAAFADAEALVGLLSELGYTLDGAVVDERLRNIRASGGEVLVAESAGQVVGCVNVSIAVRLAEGSAGEIVSLVVGHKHRGRGVGKALVSRAVAWLRTAGCEAIRVRANSLRHDAHGFYLGLGFTELKTQKVFVKNV